jgi:hypothetical protein
MLRITTLALALFASHNASSQDLSFTESPLQSGASSALNVDEEMALIADQIPGFAGFVTNAKGQTTVRMTKRASNAKAAAANSAALERYFGKFQTQTAEFDARQLLNWKVAATQLLSEFSLAQSVDLDEVKNRIVIGVLANSDRSIMKALRARALELGIDAGALVVEVSSQVLQQATLRDKLRPMAGGAQMAVDTGAGSLVCTAGANVRRNGVVGFVTAAHCLRGFTPANGLFAFQPSSLNTNDFVARVAAVGPLLTSSSNAKCPSGAQCKLADAVFIEHTSAANASLGMIYVPTGYQNLTIGNTRRIKAVESVPGAGRSIFATGRTNGLVKAGTVAETCLVLKGSLDGGIFSLCLNRLNKVSGQTTAPGDSGGPVFATNSDGTVNLVGIVYGQSQDFIVYTPWSEVQKQLGTLQIL